MIKKMAGYVLLEGGAEFGGRMADPDRAALAAAGGPRAPVAVIPAAAAPDHNTQRAGQNAVNWFQRLGALHVESLPLIDRASADDPAIVDRLLEARLIYLLGGFPAHLADSLRGSRSWAAVLQAYGSGAVIAGSSAGAMVLCSDYYDPVGNAVTPALGCWHEPVSSRIMQPLAGNGCPIYKTRYRNVGCWESMRRPVP
jgi:cyanophycinase